MYRVSKLMGFRGDYFGNLLFLCPSFVSEPKAESF